MTRSLSRITDLSCMIFASCLHSCGLCLGRDIQDIAGIHADSAKQISGYLQSFGETNSIGQRKWRFPDDYAAAFVLKRMY